MCKEEPTKLFGGVIISYHHRSHAVTELLAARLRKRIELVHYIHPNAIEGQHDFLLVFSVDDLRNVVTAYQLKNKSIPLILHLDTPEVLNKLDYTTLFPHVEIIPIEQANLAEPDVTLKITLFQQIVESLETRL